jgi:hypothetical protein
MEEIIKQVVEKTGISEDLAEKAVEVVIDFLKDKLPEPLASQIDGVVSGETDLGDLAKGIGSLLGG